MSEIRGNKNICIFLTDIPIVNCCQQLLPEASESWPNFNLGAFSSLLLLLRLPSPLLLLLLGPLVLQAAANAADRTYQGGEDSASNKYAAKPGGILSNFSDFVIEVEVIEILGGHWRSLEIILGH